MELGAPEEEGEGGEGRVSGEEGVAGEGNGEEVKVGDDWKGGKKDVVGP